MADLSTSFNPADIALASDAASSALVLGATTSDAASSALALASDVNSKVAARTDQSVKSAASPKFADLQITSHAYFDAEVDNGNSGAADTIDWTAGNKQKSTLTADCTYSFTPPSGACNLLFRITNDVAGAHDITWPGNVTWLGTEPTWTDGGATATIIVALYYDGAFYWAQGTPWEF